MSELRQDIISGDWVILAPGRGKRPHFLDEKRKPRARTPKKLCPFENLEASHNAPIMLFPEGSTVREENWKIALIHNKYPALDHPQYAGHSIPLRHGIYRGRTGIGEHWLIVTKDHDKNLAALDEKNAVAVFRVFQESHHIMEKEGWVAYASSFFNWGPLAGASVWHPHYQVLALPIIPSHIARSLRGAKMYFDEHGRCGRCDIVKAEHKEKKRVIVENEHAIAFTPYASKKPFEVMILPKKHSSHFRKASPVVIEAVVSLVQSVMRRFEKNVNDPDMNVFIHDAPLGNKNYDYHHWHIEVMPKISTPAGFELSTGIDINSTDPEEAAKILRGKKPAHA